VRGYAEQVLASEPGAGLSVRLAQVGEMILKPGAAPRSFTAREELSIERVSFAWHARFPVLGPISLRVTDSYDAGTGALDVRLLGVPLQRNRGPELALAEAFRYLAEIPWVPQAILANAELEWREVDERTVEVATGVGGERVAAWLSFNESGEIVQTVANRPCAEAGNVVVPWVGVYGDYEDFGGVRVPTRGEVRWDLPEGPFNYWRGTITAFEVCRRPFADPDFDGS
jgi:hypothetical protein